MTRIHSLKSTKLYLPPVTPMGPPANSVTLEVLLMAQKIARDRGQVFDIEAFMPAHLREEWEAMKRGEEWPRKVKEEGGGEVPNREGSTTGEKEGPVKLGDGQGGDAVVGADGNGAPSGSAPDEHAAAQAPDSTTVTSTTVINDTPPIPPPTPTVPQGKQPFKLHPNHPALLNLHWKQRQKRLAQLAAREAAIAKGQVPEYYPELEAMIRLEEEKEKEREREEEVGQKRKRGMTAADVESIRASASHWNHLLVEARRMRGPQWDYNTQQYQVDRSSEEYYTHMKPPRSDFEVKQDPQQIMNGHAQSHATPSTSQSTNRPLPQSRHSQSQSPIKPPSGLSMQMPPSGQIVDQKFSQNQRRLSGASGTAATPSQGGPMSLPQNSNPNYNPSPQQHHQQMYNPPPPNQYQQQQQQPQQFNPAQFLAMQQQHQQQLGPNPNQGPGMMNPALLMQAQQRLQQQARGGQGQGPGQGVNMASLMAGHGPGQGQGQGQQTPGWNPNMGLSPAMMQSMGVGMGGGGSVGGGAGWNGGQ